MPAIIAAVVLGVVCGLLGATFVWVTKLTGRLRAKYVTKNWHKVLEVALFAVTTSLCFFLLVIMFSRCAPMPNTPHTDFTYYHQSRSCVHATEYNPMATILFNSQGGQIRVLLSNAVMMNIPESLAFISVWFLFTITTFGINVPSGLFLPAIILGCAIG